MYSSSTATFENPTGRNYNEGVIQVYPTGFIERVIVPELVQNLRNISPDILNQDGSLNQEFESYKSADFTISKIFGKESLRIEIGGEVEFDYCPASTQSVENKPDINIVTRVRNALTGNRMSPTFSEVTTPATLNNFEYSESFWQALNAKAAWEAEDPIREAVNIIK
jgi:hypothetical protein